MRGRRCTRAPLLPAGSSPNTTASAQPMIGWMPAPASFSENSNAPKRLPVSVSASAGCRSAAASSASRAIGSAPSSSE